VGALGVSDPAGRSGRASAQDRHARGDERDLLSASDRLSVALSAARTLPAALNGLQHLPQVRGGAWEAIWAELLFALREQAGREASPTAAIIDSQSLKSAEKTAGDRPLHRHPGSRRRGPGLRQNTPAVQLARAGLGRQRIQRLAGEQRHRRQPRPAHRDRQAKRRHEGLRRPAPSMGRRAHLLLVRPQPALEQGL